MDKQSYQKLVVAAAAAQHAYHTLDQIVMSDYDYDQLIAQIRQIETEHPDWVNGKSITEQVGGAIKRGLYPVKHRSPMLSLDNVFSVAETQDVLNTWGGAEIDTSYKYDGLAVSLLFLQQRLFEAATRGDRYEGESILHSVLGFDSIPKGLPSFAPDEVEIRGELIMFDDEFHRYNQKLAATGKPLAVNPRNAAAGIARRLKADKTLGAQLVFIPYSVHYLSGPSPFETHGQALAALSAWGFDLTWTWLAPPFTYHRDKPLELLAYIEERQRERIDLPFGVDGLVFRVNDYAVCDQLGFTSRAPRWAIAYKFPAEEKSTVVKNIRLQIGRTGNATPVAEVEPVSVGGVTVTNATLHNEDHIRRLGIAIGDTVLIRRAGDVVPEIASVIKRPKNRVEWTFPHSCDCGGDLIRPKGQANHVCDNLSCHHRVQRALEHFVSRNAMDIEGLGEELLEKLLLADKIRWFPDIFKLTREDILEVTSETSTRYADVIIEAIDSSRKTTVARFINALGIPMAGEGTAKRLHEWFGSFYLIMQASKTLFTAVPDIGDAVAGSLATYFEASTPWLLKLLEVDKGVTLIDEMGPCPEFAKYQDFKELLGLSKLPDTSPSKVAKTVALLADIGWPAEDDENRIKLSTDQDRLDLAEDYLHEHWDELLALEKDWRMVRKALGQVRQIQNNRPLAGSTYVITGSFDDTLGSREKLSKELEHLGAKVSGSVSSKTTAVFVGDSPGTNKLDRAKELSVPTLYGHDLRELLAKHSQ